MAKLFFQVPRSLLVFGRACVLLKRCPVEGLRICVVMVWSSRNGQSADWCYGNTGFPCVIEPWQVCDRTFHFWKKGVQVCVNQHYIIYATAIGFRICLYLLFDTVKWPECWLVFMETTGCLPGVEEPSGMWQNVFHWWSGAQVEPFSNISHCSGRRK